jgi:hypothetical protein
MAWCLDFHAPYRCRHAGACCHAPWTIPFEDGTVAARGAAGACSFLDGATALCSIHRARGIEALPVTCRMFPRIVLHDARGTFISLSHFCPTAAGLLFEPGGEASIVPAPSSLADIGDLDGLDARGTWPPLLRPAVLMDAGSYGDWERLAVSLLTRDATSPADALAALAGVTSRIARWTPGSGDLRNTVVDSFDSVAPAGEVTAYPHALAVKRWLAARLFGSWTAYQGDGGIASTVRYIQSCFDTLTRELAIDGDTREAIRRSDLKIVHTP